MIIHSGYKRLLPNNVIFLYVRILARYKIEWNRFLSMMAITTPVLSLKSVYARHKQTYTNSTNFLTCMSYTLWVLVCVCVCMYESNTRTNWACLTHIHKNEYLHGKVSSSTRFCVHTAGVRWKFVLWKFVSVFRFPLSEKCRESLGFV